MKKFIYLSHPYGGKLENRIKARRLAQIYRELFDAEGHTDWIIVNPLEELRDLEGKMSEVEILHKAVNLMHSCDEVLFAPGWLESNGCLYEHESIKHSYPPIPYHHIPKEMVA